MSATTTYDRPIKATLIVRLDNGEEWEATPEDLTKFRLANPHDAYTRFRKAITDILVEQGLVGGTPGAVRDLGDTELSPLLYLVDTAINYPDLLDSPDHTEDWSNVANLERRLRALPVLPEPEQVPLEARAATQREA